MGRRVFSRDFKFEVVRLIKERAVTVAQAARNLDVAGRVLRLWVREEGVDLQYFFPGHGQVKPEQQEITQLRREMTRLKAERDIIKMLRPILRRIRYEVRLHREAPRGLAGALAL